jgi:hypothetical protein
MSKRLAPALVSKKHPALKTSAKPKLDVYDAFDLIDGRHPWQDQVPEGFVGYPVRQLKFGKVAFFNFALAREMGLIPTSHPDELTPALEAKILATFNIQIINEYDQQNGYKAPAGTQKPHPHMATRYLQLQHANKQGKTSGDGRSIWNGTVRHRGTTWDVSSRGTGVTCLSPGSVEAQRPLKTGAAEFGYGCGLADTTELLGSAIMSEIFHLNGLGTERVLTVIDLGKGCGIGVRAAANLIRPAHLFLYLKQGRLDSLKQSTDYLIQRQVENGEWKIDLKAPDRFSKMLSEISIGFAQFAAHLERNYIFAWLDWDGDNVLANAGIIDYGSIRQFGLRHDQYRYDDVQRFSTNLNEQRGKARQTVQVFAQLVGFLETGKRRAIEDFETCSAVRQFDREFDKDVRRIFLKQAGFDQSQIELLFERRGQDVERLYATFLALEKTKTQAPIKKVADGVNRPAVFNLRSALRELPTLVLNEFKTQGTWSQPAAQTVLDLMHTSFAKKVDKRLKGPLRERIDSFTKAYVQLMKFVCETRSEMNLRAISTRAQDENRSGRITGNAAEYIVESVVSARRRGLTFAEIQKALELFVMSQSPAKARSNRKTQPTSLSSAAGRLFQELTAIAQDWEEDI